MALFLAWITKQNESFDFVNDPIFRFATHTDNKDDAVDYYGKKTDPFSEFYENENNHLIIARLNIDHFK